MAAEDRRDWPSPEPAAVARVSAGKDHKNKLKLGRCYLYVRIMADAVNVPLAETSYSIKGLKTGFSLSGTTDADGVLRHERIPDDHYEITCEGATERIELLFNAHRDRHEEQPWWLRLRGVERDG